MEFYNLAAQSFVAVSFVQPMTTAQIISLGPVHLLEPIRFVNPRICLYAEIHSLSFGENLLQSVRGSSS